jgi:D-alanyl-D-alanine carboxypeptidase (penicillin-binding protein 5/6)
VPSAEQVPIALLVDADSGQTLFAREADRRFVPASITKVMTTYVAFELIAKGTLKPEQVIPVSDYAYKNWSGKGSSLGVQRNTLVSVDTLIHAITTVSGNDAAIVLAEGAAGSVAGWVALMNREARRLGMTESHFGTPNGWMDDGRTFVSARDLSKLGRAMIARHAQLYSRYIGKRTFTYNGITQANHDPITGVVPGADGIKTGFTNQAGYGFLGTAKRGDHRLMMVVAAVDSGAARKQAAREFMEWGFTAFDRHLLLPKYASVGSVQVQGGASRSVEVRAPVPITILVPRGTRARYSLALHYIGPVEAPIRAGQEIGELEVLVDGRPSHRVPMIAAKPVPEANIVQRLLNGLVGLFT